MRVAEDSGRGRGWSQTGSRSITSGGLVRSPGGRKAMAEGEESRVSGCQPQTMQESTEAQGAECFHPRPSTARPTDCGGLQMLMGAREYPGE